MDGVHTQLPENVLSVRIDGMKTGEALIGYLLRGHTQGNVFQYLRLRGSERHILDHTVMSWCQQDLCHTLTDKPLVAGSITQTVADLGEGRVLEQHTEQWRCSDSPSHEVGRQLEAEEYPPY